MQGAHTQLNIYCTFGGGDYKSAPLDQMCAGRTNTLGKLLLQLVNICLQYANENAKGEVIHHGPAF